MHVSRRLVPLFACILLLGVCISRLTGQERRRPDAFSKPPTNLKVLKVEKPEGLRPIMRSFDTALGVECGFCHDTQDWAKDTPHKETARKMLEMVTKINTQLFTWERAPRATCLMCHNGRVVPMFNPPRPPAEEPRAAQQGAPGKAEP